MRAHGQPDNEPAAPALDDVRRIFAWLTLTKLIGNFALRLLYPFNTDIAKGLGVSLGTVGQLQGAAELMGLGAAVVGPPLDRGRYRSVTVVGTAMVGVGATVLGVGSSWVFFGIGAALIALGVPVFTIATHTWMSVTIPYARRARAIGIYETSWAVALLVGAPIAGFMIDRLTWWSPFFLFGVLALAIVPILIRTIPNRSMEGNLSSAARQASEPFRLSRPIVAIVTCAVSLTLAATLVFSTFGAWLKDRHGFSTGGIATLSIALGGVELLGSAGTALFTDRFGKRKAMAVGITVMAIGLAMALVSNRSGTLAVLGLIVTFGGFEYAYVSHLPILGEVGGPHGGTLMSRSGALVTAARAIGAVTGTGLYERYGFGSVGTLALLFAVVSIGATGMLPHLD